MAEGEDLLFRPVLRQLLDPRALWDGSIGLFEIALLNEAIDVEEENKFRYSKAMQEKAERDAHTQPKRRY